MHGAAPLSRVDENNIMQTLFDLTSQTTPPINQVGGKAFNLYRLHQMGLPVPAAIVVPASIHGSRESIQLEHLRNQILQHGIVSSGEKFAVRSSGIGEDGESNSFAGIFESYLNIPKEEIHEAVIRVWDSLNNPRSAMYVRERSASITSMGVVIQHMVTADYAGVAFSSSPIEGDSRIALLEVVRGNGDSLVSGKKTPATLRINKLTEMIRISRNGEDELSDELLEDIAQKVTPYIEQIETEYGIPVDVEWAMADGQIYILQARPITT